MATQSEFTFEVSEFRPRIPPEDILKDLFEFSISYGFMDRTQKNYWSWPDRKYHPHTITTYFGSWAAAMKAAGVSYDKYESIRPDKEAVDEDLRRFASVFPAPRRTLKNYDAWKGRRMPVGTMRSVHSTWHDAMTALGIDCPGRSKSKKNSDDDMLAATERIWRWSVSKKGRSPSQMDFQRYASEHADGVCYGTIIRRFGPMKRYLKAFADWKGGRITKGDLLKLTPEKRSRSPISPRTRYDLIRISKGRCSACGSSVQDGANLHIDHIVPVSKGGTNDKSNLRVLCQTCNLGKSNLIYNSTL